MIFVTVGSELPFDRLLKAVDTWAERHRGADVVAQVAASDFAPKHIRFQQFMTPEAFRSHMRTADLIVAHAGMGTIITAFELGKPIVVMPRRPEFREVRNAHQIATCRQLEAQGRVLVAYHEAELGERIAGARRRQQVSSADAQPSARLLAVLKRFIQTGVYDSADPLGVGLRAAPAATKQKPTVKPHLIEAPVSLVAQ